MSDFSLPEPFKSLFGWITAIISVITGVTGVVLLWQSNQTVVAAITISVGVIFLWIFFVLLYLSRKTPSNKQAKRKQKGDYLYSQKTRTVGLIGVIAIPVIFLSSVITFNWVNNRSSNETIILIANYDGEQPDVYKVSDFVIEKIRKVTRGIKNVKVEALQESITSKQGSQYAKEIGTKKKARIVIWGWYSVTDEAVYLTTHVEILNVPFKVFGSKSTRGDESRDYDITRSIEEIKSFTFQTNLSDSVAASSLFALGLINYYEQDYQNAINLYSDALHILPKDSYLENQAQIYSERAMAYKYLGKLDLALEDASHSIELVPPSHDLLPVLYHNRGMVYEFRQEYDKALADFEKTIQISEKPPAATLYMEGVVFYSQGNYQGSVDILTDVIQIDPNNFMAYFQRGTAYLELGLKDKAKDDFIKVQSLSDDPYVNNITEIMLKNTN